MQARAQVIEYPSLGCEFVAVADAPYPLVLTPTGPADPTLLAAVQAAVKAAGAADAAEASSRAAAPPKQPS